MVELLKQKMLLTEKLERINESLEKFNSELENDLYTRIMNVKLQVVKDRTTKELLELTQRMEG